jgi:hypothetical protein
MTDTQPAQEAIERLLDRMATLSQRFASDAEEQFRQLDQRARDWLDRGEAATDRLIKTIDKEVRSQMVSLRREIDDLGGRLAELRQNAEPPKAAARRATAKKTATKKATGKGATAKKAKAKKRSTKKTAKP